MIGRLQGSFVEQTEDGTCIIDVHGVGYEVFVPGRVRGGLASGAGPVCLYIHTHVREDALVLYGFLTAEERTAFRALIGVSGVGPKIALTILSQLTAAELASAIARGDKNRLKAISGVGKKTAERLVIDLADKLPAKLAAPSAGAPTGCSPEGAEIGNETSAAISALVQMGFARAEAERAVTNAKASDESLSLEGLLRRALGKLA